MEFWRNNIRVGDRVDGLDTDGKWYECEVIKVEDSQVTLHYRAWCQKYDTTLNKYSCSIQPPYSIVPKWRDFISIGDVIEVKGKMYPPTWYLCIVIDKNDESKEIHISYGFHCKTTKWINIDDGDICALGTHVTCEQNVSITVDGVSAMKKAQRNKCTDAVLTETSSCCICYDSLKRVVMLPCKHLCICVQCSYKYTSNTCPICKMVIEERMIVYV